MSAPLPVPLSGRDGYLGAHGVLALFTAKGAVLMLALGLAFLYIAGPLFLYGVIGARDVYLEMAGLTVLAILGLYLGVRIPFLDRRVAGNAPKLGIKASTYICVVGTLFIIFILITLITAPSIPLISAILGSDAATLSLERGEFLKGREGPWIALLYLSTIFMSTLVPYSVVFAYSGKSHFRHLLALLFLVFAVSFMMKVLFLNLMIPIFAYALESRRLKKRHLMYFLGGAMLLTLAMISLSGYGESELATGEFEISNFFSASFGSGSSWQFFIYRSIAVPIFTAIDTLIVHATIFDGQLFMGSTSSLLAALTGQERVNLERHVFEFQFGGWNDIANANTVYVLDAFVNFGWIGVFVVSAIIGLTLRMFRISSDPAFRALAPLYIFQLVMAPFIGILLSSGFLLIFLQALFIKVKK